MSQILEILKRVVHPEQGKDIVSLGMVENLTETDGVIRFTLQLHKPHDPVAGSLKRAAEAAITAATGITPAIIIAEPNPKKVIKAEPKHATHATVTIAVASGKGGVGKSTVTANLAVSLARRGYKVGIIDADIYGPSMPKMFGTEDYMPIALEGSELIVPAEAHGVKIMSVGYFIKPTDALVWRGPMATSALKQLIHQTAWGELDFLLIDLPPGTGDIHLTAVAEMKIDGAIIVSTPQKVALMDVVRGIKMFQGDKIAIPIIGIVSNMAYFTPAELPYNRYYIFGKGEIEKVAAETGTEIIAEIPLVQSIAEGGDSGNPISADKFDKLTNKITELWKK